jgi:hypothetical protein
MSELINGHPGVSPGEFVNPASANKRSLVKVGKWSDRRYRDTSAPVRRIGKIVQRGYGKGTSGSITKVGRQSNRSK